MLCFLFPNNLVSLSVPLGYVFVVVDNDGDDIANVVGEYEGSGDEHGGDNDDGDDGADEEERDDDGDDDNEMVALLVSIDVEFECRLLSSCSPSSLSVRVSQLSDFSEKLLLLSLQ